MFIREALPSDIPRMQVIRNSVRENMLSDPSLVTDEDCLRFITETGKGWVGVINNEIAGFSIIDCEKNNVWALFVHPGFEGKGIGRKLHDTMMDWYFNFTSQTCWLGTAPGTRAESFYRKAGWKETGTHGKGEIKFEITSEAWRDAAV